MGELTKKVLSYYIFDFTIDDIFFWKFPSLISDASSEDVKKINIIHYILLSSAIYLCS